MFLRWLQRLRFTATVKLIPEPASPRMRSPAVTVGCGPAGRSLPQGSSNARARPLQCEPFPVAAVPAGGARCSGRRRAGRCLPRTPAVPPPSGGKRPGRRGAATAAPLPQAPAPGGAGGAAGAPLCCRFPGNGGGWGGRVAKALDGALSLAYDVYCSEPIQMGLGARGACPRAVRRAVPTGSE